jgi:hypothetical protein
MMSISASKSSIDGERRHVRQGLAGNFSGLDIGAADYGNCDNNFPAVAQI